MLLQVLALFLLEIAILKSSLRSWMFWYYSILLKNGNLAIFCLSKHSLSKVVFLMNTRLIGYMMAFTIKELIIQHDDTHMSVSMRARTDTYKKWWCYTNLMQDKFPLLSKSIPSSNFRKPAAVGSSLVAEGSWMGWPSLLMMGTVIILPLPMVGTIFWHIAFKMPYCSLLWVM